MTAMVNVKTEQSAKLEEALGKWYPLGGWSFEGSEGSLKVVFEGSDTVMENEFRVFLHGFGRGFEGAQANLNEVVKAAEAVLTFCESEGLDTGMGGPLSDLRDAIASNAHSAPAQQEIEEGDPCTAVQPPVLTDPELTHPGQPEGGWGGRHPYINTGNKLKPQPTRVHLGKMEGDLINELTAILFKRYNNRVEASHTNGQVTIHIDQKLDVNVVHAWVRGWLEAKGENAQATLGSNWPCVLYHNVRTGEVTNDGSYTSVITKDALMAAGYEMKGNNTQTGISRWDRAIHPTKVSPDPVRALLAVANPAHPEYNNFMKGVREFFGDTTEFKEVVGRGYDVMISSTYESPETVKAWSLGYSWRAFNSPQSAPTQEKANPVRRIRTTYDEYELVVNRLRRAGMNETNTRRDRSDLVIENENIPGLAFSHGFVVGFLNRHRENRPNQEDLPKGSTLRYSESPKGGWQIKLNPGEYEVLSTGIRAVHPTVFLRQEGHDMLVPKSPHMLSWIEGFLNHMHLQDSGVIGPRPNSPTKQSGYTAVANYATAADKWEHQICRVLDRQELDEMSNAGWEVVLGRMGHGELNIYDVLLRRKKA